MKKLLTLISLFTIVCSTYAQVNCSTIANVRAQKNGTEVLYTGTATTTFYSTGGILIEDETGYLFIKGRTLGEWGSAKVKTNMKISNILGIYKAATNEEMSQIHVEFDEDINAIQIKAQNATFNPTEVALNDFLAKPESYECQPIKLTNIDVTSTGWSYHIGSENQTIALVPEFGVTIPARGTFQGFYGNNGTKGFIIPSAECVYATAYNTITDLKNAYETDAPNSLEIIEPMVVNYVRTNNDNSIDVYVQQTDKSYTTSGLLLHIDAYPESIEIGDRIQGVNGLFSTFKVDDYGKIQKGSTINITEDEAKSIKIINKNNNVETTKIDDLEYIISYGAINYEAIYAISPKGTIAKKGTKHILQTKSQYVILEGLDFSKYEGQNLAIAGIIDAGNINPGETSIIVRDEKDIYATNLAFKNIAEMKAAGEPLATGVTYTLANNVLVTHTHSWLIPDLNLTIYAMIVQDETGGMYIESQSKLNVTAGDSINGIFGSYHGYIALKSATSIKVLSQNNLKNIVPEIVTMRTLATEPEKYANTVVKMIGVGHGQREVNNYGTTIKEKYLYQGTDTMVYEIWKYNLYASNDIVGIFDYGSYLPFSFIPLGQEYITKSTPTNIDQTNVSSIIFHNGIIIDSQADRIEVYNINGQMLKYANNNTISISDLQYGIYIIKCTHNNETKITKIINY
jgi:hypothetical protein